MPVPLVTVYSRPGCRLCEKLMAQLEGLRSQAEFTWEEVNIDEDPVLRERYNEQVPVVAMGGEDVFFHRLDASKFLEKLKASA
jgi:glutaredoxin